MSKKETNKSSRSTKATSLASLTTRILEQNIVPFVNKGAIIIGGNSINNDTGNSQKKDLSARLKPTPNNPPSIESVIKELKKA